MHKQTSFVSTCTNKQVLSARAQTNKFLSPTVTFLGSNPFKGDDILVSQTVTIFTFTLPLSLQITLEMKLCIKIQVFWVVTMCHWACSSWRFTTHIINICTIHSIYPRQPHTMKYCTHTHTHYHWPVTNKWQHTHFTACWDILQGSNFRTCIILSNKSQARVPVQTDST